METQTAWKIGNFCFINPITQSEKLHPEIYHRLPWVITNIDTQTEKITLTTIPDREIVISLTDHIEECSLQFVTEFVQNLKQSNQCHVDNLEKNLKQVKQDQLYTLAFAQEWGLKV